MHEIFCRNIFQRNFPCVYNANCCKKDQGRIVSTINPLTERFHNIGKITLIHKTKKCGRMNSIGSEDVIRTHMHHQDRAAD